MKRDRLTTGAAVIVLATWTTAFVNGMLTQDYLGLQIVSPIMGLLAGYLFCKDFILRKPKGSDNDDHR